MPDTPQTPHIPQNYLNQFSVDIGLCFLQGADGEDGTPLLSMGLIVVEPDKFYATPQEKLNHGQSVKDVQRSILDKHIKNNAARQDHASIFCGLLDKPLRHKEDNGNRISLVYSVYIPDFAITTGLKWFSEEEIVELLNKKQLIKDHSQIIAKAIFYDD